VNRLWVRFTLVVVGILLLVVVLPAGYSLAVTQGWLEDPAIGGQMQDIRQALPPALQAEFDERMALFAWHYFIRALLMVIVVGSIIGLVLSRSLTAPLRQLEAGAEAIAAQNLAHRVPLEGSQEMKAVAHSFNQMAAQLEAAEKVRRSLLADVAHELRNPLHVLRGNLQAILDEVYPLSQEEIARLLDQTGLLTTLVDDLHDLAQAEAQRMPLHKQLADMADLVKETAVFFKPLAQAKGVTLQVELLGPTPYYRVDPDRLRQAVHNLLINALAHTPEKGEIWVTVVEEQDSLRIRVRDSGAGIEAEHLPFVFDRFYRADSARSRDRGGAGLGLAIVKAIVEAHGGWVTAVSPGAGRGSVFEIGLPGEQLIVGS
jgi:signal transduction histidine kinase